MNQRTGMALVAILVALAARAEDQFFDSNGVKLHYTIEGKGEPVVLLHGFAANMVIQWKAPPLSFAQRMAKDFQVICLDNRGHGKSDKPAQADAYGTEMVEDVVRLLDHLKIKKAHIAGYSMGAFLTAKFVALHPERVQCAILGGAGAIRVEDKDDPLARELADSLDQGKGISPLLRALTPPGETPPSEEQLRRVNTMLIGVMKIDTKALAACVRAMTKLGLSPEELSRNKVPVLCIVGDKDPLKGRSVDVIDGKLANLEIVIVKGGNHFNTFVMPVFFEKCHAFIDAHRMMPRVQPAATGARPSADAAKP